MKQQASAKTVYFLLLALLISLRGFAQSPVASFTASSIQACAPASIQFTNTSLNAVSYSWVFGNGNTSTQQNPGNVYSSAGTYTVTLTATSASGQTSVASSVITVAAPPVASFTAAGTIACRDYGVIQFQNSSTGYDSCVWDFGDGTTSTVVNPAHSYAVDGIFTVKLMVYNKVLGCSNMQVRNAYVTIRPRPSANLSVDTAETCDLNHVFNFNASITSPATSWQWDFGDGSFSSVQGPVSHTYSSPGTYVVRLILQNNFGCADTSILSDTVKVKDNPVPFITITDTLGCEPLAVSFINQTLTPAVYLWDFGDGTSSSTRITSKTYPAGVYIPYLTVNYNSGCSRVIQLDTINSLVSPYPTFAMQNASGCAPLGVNFINNTAGNNTYLWYFGDGDSSYLASPFHIYDSVGYFVPTLIATSPGGCTRVYSSGWTYVNASGPIIDFRPDVTSGCSPLTVNFNNYSSGATTWLWDFGDGTTSALQNPSHIYTASGTYTVKLIAQNAMGCKDTLVYPVNITVSTMNVTSVPAAPIFVCAPYTVFFSDNTAASSWLWDFGDGTTSTLSNPGHTYSTPGTYVVNLTVQLINGGCSYTIQNFQTFIVDGTQPGFTYSVTSCPPYIVTFTDTSVGGTATHWSFGDGGSSTQQHPVHTYPGTGSFTVLQTATSPGGCAGTLSASGAVTIVGLNANATMITSDTIAPFVVNFFANSTQATSWFWDFGDGSTSTLANPTHTYATTGPFNVSLTISNDSCSYTYINPPITVGTANGSGGGIGNPVVPPYQKNVRCAPYSVNFYCPVSNPASVLWDFGDGMLSTLLNPTHIYADSGSFVPVFYFTDSSGVMDTVIFSDTFFVAKAPSDFLITTRNSCNGIVVDVSVQGNGLTNTWFFNGGNTASGNSATHIYPNISGNNIIRLNSVDTNGCKADIVKSFTVDVNNPLSAGTRRTCAGDSVVFSCGNMNFSQYSWDFGDGQFGSMRDPVHAYADSGIYQVVLTVTDMNGCTLNYSLAYTIEVFDPVAAFTILQPTGNCTWVHTQVFNNSTGADSYFWDFGDGQTSSLFSTFHYYTTPGWYDITLTAYKNVCQSTMVLPNAVYVPQLTPNFTFITSGNCLPSTVQFTDVSTDAVKWFWDFGDGDTSSLQHPVHIYTRPPSAPVTLTVTDLNGCMKTIVDTVLSATAADFTFSSIGGCMPFSVTFNDTSYNGVSWFWDFGDGTTSTLPSPVHSYANDGVYPVTLSVTGPDGCISQKTLTPGITVMTPVAAFNADSLNGCAPLMVNFVNESSGATAYHWDFGDGDVSGLEHPQHVYAYPGTYTVSLIAMNSFGCADTLVLSNYIVTRGSLPDFTLTPLSGCNPLQVQFTDQSVGAVAWQWYFGDGNTVNGANVSHVYADTGSFTPSLYTTDSTGCTSVFTYPQPVVVHALPQAVSSDQDFSACLPVTVNYSAAGTVADSLVYYFGDGTSSGSQNVTHVYAIGGIYQPFLVAFNSEGCTDTVYLTPVRAYELPQAAFSATDTVGCYPLAISFNNASLNLNNATAQWDFGNGVTDTSFTPSVLYTTNGIFDITLIITNDGVCSDTLTLSGYITVYDQLPPAAVNWNGITVNNNSEVQLDFVKSTEPDIDYYTVYRLNTASGNFDSLAVIYQNMLKNQTLVRWKDQSATPAIGPCSYRVVATDICGYRLPDDSLSIQTTVNLQTLPGFMNVGLTWTPYGGKTPDSYEIFRSSQGAAPRLIGTVANTVTSFVDTAAYCPSAYTYTVRARDLDGSVYTSFGNSSDATPASDIFSQEVPLTRTTVVDNSFTLTEWKDPLQYPWAVQRYQVYRSTDNVQFSLIADVPSFVHEYEDHSAQVQFREYYYRVTAVTECGNSDYSNPGSSIWLQARENNLHYFLQWTPYKEWDSGVDTYRIEKLSPSGIWEEFRTVNGSVTEVEEQ